MLHTWPFRSDQADNIIQHPLIATSRPLIRMEMRLIKMTHFPDLLSQFPFVTDNLPASQCLDKRGLPCSPLNVLITVFAASVFARARLRARGCHVQFGRVVSFGHTAAEHRLHGPIPAIASAIPLKAVDPLGDVY